jgi:TetR/AcrR family transcriptional regulator, mexCD-oprJ operon repressor
MDRERVLRAAAEFLGRQPNATQDEIAAAVGISRATLHRYFAGRTALLEALDQLALAQMHEALKTARLQDDSAAEALRRLAAACEPVSGYLLLLYAQNQCVDSFNKPDDPWVEIETEIRELFERGQRAGEFRPELSAVWLTEAFLNLCSGAAWIIKIGEAGRREFPDMVANLLMRGASRS